MIDLLSKTQYLVHEGLGDEDKVLTESQDEDRANALPPFPVFRHKGIGCSEVPKLKEREKVRVTTIKCFLTIDY